MKRSTLSLMTAAGLLCLFFCGEMSTTGNGGSSETINALILITDTIVNVTVDNADEQPFVVQVFATDYRPYEMTGFTTTVDSRTAPPSLSVPETGAFNFLITLHNDNRSCFIRDVAVVKGKTDSITCTFSRYGRVRGRLVLRDSTSIGNRYVLSVPGSPFTCLTDTTNSFSFEGVPAGSYSMTVQSAARRLFIAKAKYEFSTDNRGDVTILDVILP